MWGGILGATGAYLYTRNIPTQLKIIQARILAQAGLIVGAVSMAGVSYVTSAEKRHKPATSSWKLRDYSVDASEFGGAAARHAVPDVEVQPQEQGKELQ